MIKINKETVLNNVKELLTFDSPTGFCFEIMDKIKNKVTKLGYKFEINNKGCGIITIPGKSNEKVIGLSAHVDTLGAMVRSITEHGTLKFTKIGGSCLPTLDSEYCKIRTRDGKIYTGTFLASHSSVHVYEDASEMERTEENMEIRIDEYVDNKEDVLDLGISNGDIIFIDPKTTITDKDFIKSRFIDDKGSVACLLSMIQFFKEQKIVPNFTTKIIISTYEEVGHGSSNIPEDITELISVDMGCIGADLECSEYDVSICAKDSGGPYDYNMVSKLINLAKVNDLNYVVDIYPRYGSDVGAALRGGNNIRGALIGPGVSASHGMERTHYAALENTIRLLYLYLTDIEFLFDL